MNYFLSAFVICLGIVAALLLNGLVLCLVRPFTVAHVLFPWYVSFVCGLAVSLDVPSFRFLFCMRKDISEFGIVIISGVCGISDLLPDVFRQVASF